MAMVAQQRDRSSSRRTVVIAEAPFFFSIAALSASLAGLAGLVAGLRRGEGIRAIDLFRLREIVEFAFVNIVLALTTIPLATLTGSTETAIRIVAVAAVIYMLIVSVLLLRRQRTWSIEGSRGWYLIVLTVDAVALAAAGLTVIGASTATFEVLLISLLARPMLAFLLVLTSFEHG